MLERWTEKSAFDFDVSEAVGVLCVGSCEQHSVHLPVGTDSYLALAVCEDAARLAKSRVLLLPAQQIGYSPHHRAFAGYITLSQPAMFQYYLEICRCAFESGLKRLLIVNAHGGNQSCLQTVVNELGAVYAYRALLVRYWDLIVPEINSIRESGPGGMGHAGEFETSMMLHYHPELVDKSAIREYPAPEGNEYHGPDLLARNMVYQYKPFDEYSPQGNVGQPSYASAEKGRRFALCAYTALAKLIDRCAEDFK